MKEIIERNERGQVTHSRNIHGFEEWYEYDAHSNETYYRDSTGMKCKIPVEDKINMNIIDAQHINSVIQHVVQDILRELQEKYRILRANDGSQLFYQMRDYINKHYLTKKEPGGEQKA